MSGLGWRYCVIAGIVLILVGCFPTLEQRWEKIDQQMQQQIGVKTKDHYLSEWGNPAKRTTTANGESIWTWEFRGYGGRQGWNKILTFTPDGVLKEFHRDYWPKE